MKHLFLLLLFYLPQSHHAQVMVDMNFKTHIVLQAKINGKQSARLVLDSGADGLYLDSVFFAEKGFPANRRQLATLPGAGATPQQIMVILDTMKADFNGVPFVPRYTPLIDLRKILGGDVDGIIGMNFLSDYVVQLDYDSAHLKLFSKNDFKTPDGYKPIDLIHKDNRIYIPIEITVSKDIMVTENFQIDLGNGGTLDITSAIAEKYNLPSRISKKLRYVNKSGGIGGEVIGNQFRAQSMKIGSFELKEPVIDYSEDQAGALSRGDIGGLLGNKILNRFSVILDFPDGKLYLKPKDLHSPYQSTLVGFSFSDQRGEYGGLMVTGIYEGTQAQEVGIQTNDVIIEINGTLVKNMRIDSIRDLFKKEGTDLKLKFKRGERLLQRTLELKEYL